MFRVKPLIDSTGISIETAALSLYDICGSDNNHSVMFHYDDPNKYSQSLQAHATRDVISIMFSMVTKNTWNNPSVSTFYLTGTSLTGELNLIVRNYIANTEKQFQIIFSKADHIISRLKKYIEFNSSNLSKVDNGTVDNIRKTFLEKIAKIFVYDGNIDSQNYIAKLDNLLREFKEESELVERAIATKPGNKLA